MCWISEPNYLVQSTVDVNAALLRLVNVSQHFICVHVLFILFAVCYFQRQSMWLSSFWVETCFPLPSCPLVCLVTSGNLCGKTNQGNQSSVITLLPQDLLPCYLCYFIFWFLVISWISCRISGLRPVEFPTASFLDETLAGPVNCVLCCHEAAMKDDYHELAHACTIFH